MEPTGKLHYQDLWPDTPVGESNATEDVKASYNDEVVTEKQLTNTDVTESEGRTPDGAIRLKTSRALDAKVEAALAEFKRNHSKYNAITTNCSNFAEIGITKAAGTDIGAKEMLGGRKVTTPNQLYKATRALRNANVLKDPGDKVNHTFLEGMTGSKAESTFGDWILQYRLKHHHD